MHPDLRAQLQAQLVTAFPARAAVTIGPLSSLTTGWESELYAFDLTYTEAGQPKTEPLILRLHAGGGAQGKTEHEFNGLRQLAAAGYPVPRAVYSAGLESALGRPFMLIERIDGVTMWSQLERAEGAAAALLDQFGRLFVQLHRLAWQPFAQRLAPNEAQAWLAGTPEAPFAFVDAWLTAARQTLARSPSTGLEPMVKWLAAHRGQAPCREPAVVHRDFHPNNILLRPDGSAVVIDWTGLGVSDPRFDLAWTLLLARMFAGPGVRELFLSAYERHAGAPVEQIEWFEVVACARRFHEVLATLAAGDAATGRRPGAQDLMRQQLAALRPGYAFLQAHTGLALPALAALLSEK
jgi:aminoglycoside phosphotransferase (APT) family kinase protein